MKSRILRQPWISALLLGLVAVMAGTAGVPSRSLAGQSAAPEPFPFSDRYPAEVLLDNRGDLDRLVAFAIDIGTVRTLDESAPYPRPVDASVPLIATVYINDAEANRLRQVGLEPTVIPNESLRAWREYGPGTDQPSGWPTWEQWEARMLGLANSYPDLVRLFSIGQSVQGRQLWVLKITDNPDLEEDEPEFRYWSTHHGNEATGGELTMRLAELLTSGYGVDPDLTALVDGMEIYLHPIYNPDGYVAGSRYNAHGQDLNRDFPDRITDPVDDPAGREPETQANMYFQYGRRIVMGANYHAGVLVVNYPWDSVPTPPDYAPDDELFYEYSVGYAIRNPDIYYGGFPSGVTRGWEWYIIRGGMQDWAYHWHDEHHVTIEVSNPQPPPYNQMQGYWDKNREAMLWWMGRALTGVRGLVTDAATGQPLGATVDVLQVSKPMRTDPDVGDYHRLLLPGMYTVKCTAEGYLDQTWTVQVTDGPATVRHCAMVPEGGLPTLHVAAILIRYQDLGGGRYSLTGRVRVAGQGGAVVPGVLAQIEWRVPSGATTSQEALTNQAGTAQFRLKSRQTGTFELCVTGLSKAGYEYDPDQNVETCDTLPVP